MGYSWKGKVAIITGSSQGIGKSIAQELAQRGAKVVINGRNAHRIEQCAEDLKPYGEHILPIVADITRYSDCEQLVASVMEHFGKIDVLVNNAGMSMRGTFEEVAPEVFRKIMDVNYHGTVNMTKACLPQLKEQQGQVMFISSIAGIRGIQQIGAYSAAKMALTALAESLRIELHGSGVGIGITYVGYTQNAPGKTTIGPNGKPILIEPRSGRAPTPQQVAQKVVRNIETGRFKSILSTVGKLNNLMNKLFPSLVDRILIAANQRVEKMDP
jgi:NAD(P)-dependent dehydrogenase (short-subunit alcohol dehydrogenase family)